MPCPIPDDEWRRISEEAEAEIIPMLQREIRDKLYELAEHIDSVPDTLPFKKAMTDFLRIIADDLSMPGITDPDTASDGFLRNMDYILKPLGCAAIRRKTFFELQQSDDTLRPMLQCGSPLPEHLRSISAARRELQELQPWTENGIGEERDSARASMEEIYTRFPELRLNPCR